MPKRIRSHHSIYHSKQAKGDLAEFAEIVKTRRKQLGLSQTELIAKMGLGFSVSQLSNIELEKNWPGGPVIYRLCRVLGIRIPAAAPKRKTMKV